MVAVFIVDGRQRCRFLNVVAEELTGVSNHQARNQPLADILWRGADVPFESSTLGRALGSADGGDGEESIRRYDGDMRRVAFRVCSLGTAAGDGALVELVDLSGETGMGRVLRESEQRLRLAAEASGTGIWDVNAATGTRRWSPEMVAILGLPPGTEPDQDLFSSLIHPEERATIDEMYRRAYASPADAVFNTEFRIRRQNDGAERWVAVSGRIAFDASGRALRGIGTLSDVHERRQIDQALRESEERNRMAIEANDVGTWDFDSVTGEHRWSAPFRKLWGLPAAGPSDPNLLRPLIDAKDWERALAVWQEALNPAGSGRLTAESQIRRADDGALRWCAFAGQIFFNQVSKKPVRALGIMTDITERRAVEERQRLILREMNHRVKNSLALVQAIVSQTVRLTPDPRVAFDRIQSRLMSLARTHDFLSHDNWAGISLRKLILGEIDAFVPDGNRVVLRGEHVLLDSSSMFALGLTFHELAANAVRHGALAVPEGRVEVDWRIVDTDGKPQVEITWVERGGRAPVKPAVGGFGSRLIEANIRATLGGVLDVAYPSEGLRCTISFPLRPVEINDRFPEQDLGRTRGAEQSP